MTIHATAAVSASAPPPPPPPPPPLSPVQQGDVAAGRLKLVEGRPFVVGDPAAPAVSAWGDQPAGSPYRQAYDAAAARLGTGDRAAVTAEISGQLYGAPADASALAGASATATAPTKAGDGEGIGSFFEGAIKGDFGGNDSWSSLIGQSAVGFIPIVGQIADARDTIAAIGDVAQGKEGAWGALGMAAVAWVPGIGDLAKNGLRGADKLADAGADVVRRGADDVAEGTADAGARLSRSVDPATGRVTIRGEGGAKGDWPKELNAKTLEPNADYHINGYHYATDANGRVASVQGKLDLEVAERNGYQQRVSGREDRLPDDQGGHLIASIFNGPGDRLNLVPMNGNLNTGRWKAMENSLAKDAADGKDVRVRVEVAYDGTSGRPEMFRIHATVDGQVRRYLFENKAGG